MVPEQNRKEKRLVLSSNLFVSEGEEIVRQPSRFASVGANEEDVSSGQNRCSIADLKPRVGRWRELDLVAVARPLNHRVECSVFGPVLCFAEFRKNNLRGSSSKSTGARRLQTLSGYLSSLTRRCRHRTCLQSSQVSVSRNVPLDPPYWCSPQPGSQAHCSVRSCSCNRT